METPDFQIIALPLFSTPTIGAHLRPNPSPEDLRSFWSHILRLTYGHAIVFGDLNARHKNWDRSTNKSGRFFFDRTHRHGFSIRAPASSTFSFQQGTSTVVLLFLRNIEVSSLTTSDNEGLSDHTPVHAEIPPFSLASLDYVPKSVLENRTYRRRVSADYQKLIPSVMDQLSRTSTP